MPMVSAQRVGAKLLHVLSEQVRFFTSRPLQNQGCAAWHNELNLPKRPGNT